MIRLGIYEKALPKEKSINEHLKIAKNLGFDYYELSIDETDERLSRLDWNKDKRLEIVKSILDTGVKIQSMCLSGHRRFPFGSNDVKKRETANIIMKKAIDLASDLGIRVIQLAGYDVYYEKKTFESNHYFIKGIRNAVNYASKKQITLAIEIMDDPYINSISKYMKIKEKINSSFLKVYPDIGNLSAWPNNNVADELRKGKDEIVAIHLKDTIKVSENFPGKFKEVEFGEGCVNFRECFKTLNEINYCGPFLIEMWSENIANPEIEIEDAKKFILKELEESGAYQNEY